MQIYGWPDGSSVSIKFVPSYPSFGIEFEMIPKIGQERFFWNYSRGPTGPVDPHSKISRVFFDMGLIGESAVEEGAWICPTSEEIELRRLLDEPHPLLLPFDELKAWMLSAGERR